MRDQAGMSYGISGDLAKSRSIFEKGIADDPDYPLNYYNLACAEAGEKNLPDAKLHLQQAFDRKAHVNPGEAMPVPTEDDSFLPYKDNPEFYGRSYKGLRRANSSLVRTINILFQNLVQCFLKLGGLSGESKISGMRSVDRCLSVLAE